MTILTYGRLPLAMYVFPPTVNAINIVFLAAVSLFIHSSTAFFLCCYFGTYLVILIVRSVFLPCAVILLVDPVGDLLTVVKRSARHVVAQPINIGESFKSSA